MDRKREFRVQDPMRDLCCIDRYCNRTRRSCSRTRRYTQRRKQRDCQKPANTYHVILPMN